MESNFKYCPSCGTQNLRESQECVRCGLVFEKFKKTPIVIEEKKEKKSPIPFFILFLVLFLLTSYMGITIILEKEFAKGSESNSNIFNLILRIEMIYKRIPKMDLEEKKKYIKEIDSIIKAISLIPVSEDAEKVNLLEENLKDIKRILENNNPQEEKINEIIEKRFNKLKENLQN